MNHFACGCKVGRFSLLSEVLLRQECMNELQGPVSDGAFAHCVFLSACKPEVSRRHGGFNKGAGVEMEIISPNFCHGLRDKTISAVAV